MNTTVGDRFWAKVRKTDGCWYWHAGLATSGHGIFSVDAGKRRGSLAHRVSWEMHKGPLPNGATVRQTCGNRNCVRPDHLVLGKPGPVKRSTEDRFWDKVDKDGPVPFHAPLLGPCWVWTASCSHGYGQLCTKLGGGKQERLLAHRLSWELHRGAVPDGMFVCHHCDNPPCVNPAHLFLGTNTDNMRDASAKGRLHGSGLTGERHPSSKLTVSQVKAIRNDPRPRSEIALAYRVHYNTVALIKRGHTWASVAA